MPGAPTVPSPRDHRDNQLPEPSGLWSSVPTLRPLGGRRRRSQQQPQPRTRQAGGASGASRGGHPCPRLWLLPLPRVGTSPEAAPPMPPSCLASCYKLGGNWGESSPPPKSAIARQGPSAQLHSLLQKSPPARRPISEPSRGGLGGC